MGSDTETDEALAVLKALNDSRLGLMSAVRKMARDAVTAGDHAKARELTLAANRLSRARTRLAAAQDKLLLAASLAGPIAALRGLAGEAEAAVANLKSISRALEAAGKVVDILRRLMGVFG